MPKDFEEHPKEPARNIAERKWRNHDIERRVREEVGRIESTMAKELEVGDLIENDEPRAGAVTRAQTRFAKEIRGMLDEHKRRTTALYRLSLLTQLRRLKHERLRRKLMLLEARQAQREQSNV